MEERLKKTHFRTPAIASHIVSACTKYMDIRQFADRGALFKWSDSRTSTVIPHRTCPSDAVDQLVHLQPASLGSPSLLDAPTCLRYHDRQILNSTASLRTVGLGGRRLIQSPPELTRYGDFDWTSPSAQEYDAEKTAVVFRSYANFAYSETQMTWLRTALHELINADKPYQPFLLVDVQNATIDLNDPITYTETLTTLVPAELHPIALLFNEQTQRAWFPLVGEYRAHYQLYQALQILSYSFPDIDAFWQIEMDARFTDNIASTLHDAEIWSRHQPRKNLWERNSQFYLPHLWQNCYTNFANHVDRTINNTGVWGPPPTASTLINPPPPPPPPRSQTTWGTTEPPDLITFSPIISTSGTQWTYEQHVHNFPSPPPPRRMSIIAMTLTSRRLLHAMSTSQRETGAWVVPESTPQTFAFLHGMKAVYVPHYVTFSGLEGREVEGMVHKGPEGDRAGGKGASMLYCKDEGGGGGYYFGDSAWLRASYFWMGDEGVRLWGEFRGGEVCLPRMILHPVKE